MFSDFIDLFFFYILDAYLGFLVSGGFCLEKSGNKNCTLSRWLWVDLGP